MNPLIHTHFSHIFPLSLYRQFPQIELEGDGKRLEWIDGDRYLAYLFVGLNVGPVTDPGHCLLNAHSPPLCQALQYRSRRNGLQRQRLPTQRWPPCSGQDATCGAGGNRCQGPCESIPAPVPC